MRAVLCHRWAGPEALMLDQVEAPRPGPGEVLLEVAAAGVNFADCLMIEGKYQERPAFPFSPGLEAAGRVAALGEGVTRVALGDRVLGLTNSGAFAESAIVRESDVFKIPEAMDWVTAAGFPITYGTSQGALRWHAALNAGERLLVHGAAGGVGLAAVEIGKALGAEVIATAGGQEKLAVAKKHGADHLIDHREEDIRERVKEITGGRGADVIFDPVGGPVFDASLRAIAWRGRLLIIGFASGEVPQIPANILLVKNISAMGVYWGSYRKKDPARLVPAFAELFTWWQEGKLKPHVSHCLPMSEATAALELLKTRKSTGKVVLTMAEDK